jgi:hypothetical protein
VAIRPFKEHDNFNLIMNNTNVWNSKNYGAHGHGHELNLLSIS